MRAMLLMMAAIAFPARAQIARVEVHPFQSTTMTDHEFLIGQKEGRPVTLAGELRLPKPGTDRLPAVVLVHGSGGVSGYVDDWAQWLNSIGFATFIFDGFSGRGITQTVEDMAQLGRLNLIVDAYRAVELLAKHPRIDPQRIVMMGFSRGGQATLYASMRRFQRMHASTGASFAAYIPFYPDCMTTFVGDEDLVDKPVRIFHGTADNWDPVANCRAYVERLKKAGKDVQLTEYAGAAHNFDARAASPPREIPRGQSVRNCKLREDSEGWIVNAVSQQHFTYADPCVERGVTVAYDAKAREAAQKAVGDFLSSLLQR